MNYGDLETEIANYLDGQLKPFGFEAIVIPEDDAGFQKAFLKGRATVFFSEETAEKTIDSGNIAQNVTPMIGVLLESRFLRGEKGIYLLAEKVKDVLTGYQPANCDMLYYIDQKFVDNKNGVFQHVINFKTGTMRVANIGEEAGYLFKNLEFPDLTI